MERLNNSQLKIQTPLQTLAARNVLRTPKEIWSQNWLVTLCQFYLCLSVLGGWGGGWGGCLKDFFFAYLSNTAQNTNSSETPQQKLV